MTKLKLGPIPENKPVKLVVELPAPLFEDLRLYADALAKETGQQPFAPEKLVAPMLERFMATDRAFRRHRAQGS
ncbi:DUF2274 domain-containing protein [Sphingomonadales bacterium 58]|uniref:DUF2274 domain-containing protein n=1 Tax=Sphingobium sp. S8 TaxID=2758385 RepID=UPI0019186250|nr:DUF2274 domain-containing protein [Sphingobium sp. S8]MBY2958967.1 DUF2274 domain-containing protein [Sphingomonadales bacterium 58]CAD7338148.1 hypothetical protein SPHS8_01914 [Sphingobium sp. S8]